MGRQSSGSCKSPNPLLPSDVDYIIAKFSPLLPSNVDYIIAKFSPPLLIILLPKSKISRSPSSSCLQKHNSQHFCQGQGRGKQQHVCINCIITTLERYLLLRSTGYYTIFGVLIRLSHNICDISALVKIARKSQETRYEDQKGNTVKQK